MSNAHESKEPNHGDRSSLPPRVESPKRDLRPIVISPWFFPAAGLALLAILGGESTVRTIGLALSLILLLGLVLVGMLDAERRFGALVGVVAIAAGVAIILEVLTGLQSGTSDGPRPDLGGVDFSGLDLARTDFADADLSGSDFTGACLRNASLERSTVVDAVFDGADLLGADLPSNARDVATGIPDEVAATGACD